MKNTVPDLAAMAEFFEDAWSEIKPDEQFKILRTLQRTEYHVEVAAAGVRARRVREALRARSNK